MTRLLSHLLLLLYAGMFLHCQPLCPPVAAAGGTPQQEQPRNSRCQKKLQTVQAEQLAAPAQRGNTKLLPLDLCPGPDFAALSFGLLFRAHQPTLNPARGPNAGPAQVFANHPNKAPPIRFS